MAAFSVHILGCGSALPTTHHHPSSQVIDLRDKLYMIDCGEGVQRQFRHEKLHFGRLIHIFISHLHGDHCFGLPGFISTLGLLGRTGTLHVHGPEGIERFLSPILEQFCHRMPYQVEIHTIDASRHALVHEDKSVKVYSIPLSHRIPAVGYLFEEKCRARHLNKAAAEFYNIPLAEYPLIIEGLHDTGWADHPQPTPHDSGYTTQTICLLLGHGVLSLYRPYYSRCGFALP